jgi:hypothetical protein
MIDAIVGLFSSSGLGAIVGAVGSWLNKREERANLKLQFEHEQAMTELSIREVTLTQSHELQLADKQIQRAQAEGDIAAELSELQTFGESVKSGAKNTGIMFVDAVRGLMRPLITVYLLIVSSYIAYQVSALVGGVESLSADELYDMYRDVISQLIFLTTVAVTWWFGTRPSGKR